MLLARHRQHVRCEVDGLRSGWPCSAPTHSAARSTSAASAASLCCGKLQMGACKGSEQWVWLLLHMTCSTDRGTDTGTRTGRTSSTMPRRVSVACTCSSSCASAANTPAASGSCAHRQAYCLQDLHSLGLHLHACSCAAVQPCLSPVALRTHCVSCTKPPMDERGPPHTHLLD